MSPRLKKGRSGLSLRMHAGGQFEAYSSPLTGIAEPGTRREIRRSDSQDHPQRGLHAQYAAATEYAASIAADAARTKVQELLHEGQRAVICRGSTATRSVFLDCQQPLALPRLNGPLTRETNPPDDLLAHALRLTGIDFRMLNTSSVSTCSDARRCRIACMHAITISVHKCADAESIVSLPTDVKPIAATSVIVHCSSRQYAVPAVATSLALIAGMCKPSLGRPPLCHRLPLPTCPQWLHAQ